MLLRDVAILGSDERPNLGALNAHARQVAQVLDLIRLTRRAQFGQELRNRVDRTASGGCRSPYAAHNVSGGDCVQKLLQVVLSAWREAERVASERPEGSRERDAAVLATERLHGLYTELLESAKADHDAAALRVADDAVESGSTKGGA